MSILFNAFVFLLAVFCWWLVIGPWALLVACVHWIAIHHAFALIRRRKQRGPYDDLRAPPYWKG